MTANRIELLGLSVLVLVATATVSPAQNTGASLLSGNTTNPVLSGQSTLLSARSELSVSPSTPIGLLSNTTGTNPLTGLPCTGPGFVIDKRCGHVAWLDVAGCEWKRGSSCKRNDQSNTGLP
jgi:hypothetical protein